MEQDIAEIDGIVEDVLGRNGEKSSQVAQLSQRNRAAGWVSFGWVVGDGVVRQYSAPNVVGARRLKALIFYTINRLLHEQRSLLRFEPLFGWLRGNVCCSS